ncbi:MAG: hypothetical protein ACTSP3_01630 [Candidatus Heimdallarchaeaceae archaeon]
MSEDSITFCPQCGNLPQRCRCGNLRKRNIIPKTSIENRKKEAVRNILKYLPRSFCLEKLSTIFGFRAIYDFYHTETSIFCFCNNLLDIKSGVISKDLVFEIAKDYLGQKIEYATIRTKIAKKYFPNLNSSKGGYALQNVFLFLASNDYAVTIREGHGLIFKITSFFMPEDCALTDEKEHLSYIGSTKGFRHTSYFHLYSSHANYYLFSGLRLNLKTCKISKETVDDIYENYKNDIIDRVTTRLNEASNYFPEIEEKDKGFAFQNAFYILTILGKAQVEKESRTMVFDIKY